MAAPTGGQYHDPILETANEAYQKLVIYFTRGMVEQQIPTVWLCALNHVFIVALISESHSLLGNKW